MKIKQLLQVGSLLLNKIEGGNLDARLLLEHTLNFTQKELFLNLHKPADNSQVVKYLLLIRKRKAKMPVAKIIGSKEFYGLTFKTSTATLDPRPDSETLIEAICKVYNSNDNLRVLELGVGSGCLIITLLTLFSNMKGVAVDASKKALNIAKENAKNHKVSNRLHLIESNWFSKVVGKFDIIISNPPYIPNNEVLAKELSYEPSLALFAGSDGLDAYSLIIPKMASFLNKNGRVFLEIGFGQKEKVEEIITQNGFLLQKVHKDLSGIERCLEFAMAK
ncbi:MAG: peptide chain release factor N(5)-glutamine methyltransferase [Alphaproteobacteria bacterium]